MVKNTEMVRLFTYQARDKESREDEKKYKNIFKNFNLTKCFYFSYTYNLTIKLQEFSLKKLKVSHINPQEHSKFSLFKGKDIESEYEDPILYSNCKHFKYYLIIGSERVKQEGFHAEDYFPWNENFMWNYSLTKEFFSIVTDKRWVLPIIHGYIN